MPSESKHGGRHTMYIENLVATASLVCETQILGVYINLSITVGQPPNSPERDIYNIYKNFGRCMVAQVAQVGDSLTSEQKELLILT